MHNSFCAEVGNIFNSTQDFENFDQVHLHENNTVLASREQLIMARQGIYFLDLYLKLFQNLLLHDNEAKEVKTINHILSNVRN